MATSPKFLEPLGKFRKRIAYANAYGTDFPVPTQTAAFLSKKSSYPHHFVEEDSDSENEDCVVVDDNGLVIATLHTPAGHKNAMLDKVSRMMIFWCCLPSLESNKAGRKIQMTWIKCRMLSTHSVGRKCLSMFETKFLCNLHCQRLDERVILAKQHLSRSPFSLSKKRELSNRGISPRPSHSPRTWIRSPFHWVTI